MLAIVEFYLTEQLNVGETQMMTFSSNRPVKSTLTGGQSLVKPALSKLVVKAIFIYYCFYFVLICFFLKFSVCRLVPESYRFVCEIFVIFIEIRCQLCCRT